MSRIRRVEGYAIVSLDGMLADASGVMPQALKFTADQRFFDTGLDGVDVVVHGRHSHEGQPNSPSRRRVILTRRIGALAADPDNAMAVLWNPDGACFEQALAALHLTDAVVGVVGATQVFGLFLDRYDVFYLSRAATGLLPGGRPVFPDVPALTPEDVLRRHGLRCARRERLDPAVDLQVAHWRRSPTPG